MSLPENHRAIIPTNSVNGVAAPDTAHDLSAATPIAASGEPRQDNSSKEIGGFGRSRQRNTPTPVEATVYWWRTDERKASYSCNQFGNLPATPIRFRCVGNMTPKYPKRYRIELAQALDWLSELSRAELTRKELRELGAALTAAVSMELGVDVAQFSGELIDFSLTPESA